MRDLRVNRRQLLCKFTRARQSAEALGDELIALWGRVLVDQGCPWAHVSRSGHQLGQRGTGARHQREMQVPQVVEVELLEAHGPPSSHPVTVEGPGAEQASRRAAEQQRVL